METHREANRLGLWSLLAEWANRRLDQLHRNGLALRKVWTMFVAGLCRVKVSVFASLSYLIDLVSRSVRVFDVAILC